MDKLTQPQDSYTLALNFTLNNVTQFSNHTKGMVYLGLNRKYNDFEGWRTIDKIISEYSIAQPYTVLDDKQRAELINVIGLLRSNKVLSVYVREYYWTYWNNSMAFILSAISSKTSIVLFDMCTVQGPRRTIKTVQRLLNRYYDARLVVTGNISDELIHCISLAISKDEALFVSELLHEYCDNMLSFSEYVNRTSTLPTDIHRIVNLRNYLRLL